MAIRIANNAVEAMQWATKGSFGGVMPVHEITSSGKANGTITGVRKATIWDKIKVSLTYSKEEKIALAKAKSIGLAKILWKDTSVRISEDGTTVRATNARHESSNAIAQLFQKKALNKALERGLFSVGQDNAIIIQEASGKKLPKGDLDPAVKKDLKAAQKWVYTYRDNAESATRRYLDAVGVGRNGSNKNTSGTTGWAPSREIGRGVASWGQFSTIISRRSEIVPSVFPQTFTDTNDRYDDNGYLIASPATEWTLLERDEGDLAKGVAKYITHNAAGEAIVRQFAKEELISHPRNLLLEHTSGPYAGCTTMWMVLPDEDVTDANGDPTLHWVRSTFDKKGRTVNTDGNQGNKKKLITVKDMSCPNPFTFVSKIEERMDKTINKTEPGAPKKTRFAEQVEFVKYSESRQTNDINNENVISSNTRRGFAARGVEELKEHNEELKAIAPKYEAKFNAILRNGIEVLGQRLTELHTKINNGTATLEEMNEAGVIFREHLPELNRVQENRNLAHARKQIAANLPKNLQLTPHPALNDFITDAYEEKIDGAGTSYRAGRDKAENELGEMVRGNGRHVFTPTIYQIEHWREEVLRKYEDMTDLWLLERAKVNRLAEATNSSSRIEERNLEAAIQKLVNQSGSNNRMEIFGNGGVEPNPKAAHIAHWTVIRMMKDATEIAHRIERDQEVIDGLLNQIADLGPTRTNDQDIENTFKRFYMSYVNKLALLRAHSEHLALLIDVYPTMKENYHATHGAPRVPFDRFEDFNIIANGENTIADNQRTIDHYESVLAGFERRIGGLDDLLITRNDTNETNETNEINESSLPPFLPIVEESLTESLENIFDSVLQLHKANTNTNTNTAAKAVSRTVQAQVEVYPGSDEEDYVPAEVPAKVSAKVPAEEPRPRALSTESTYEDIDAVVNGDGDADYVSRAELEVILPPPEQFASLPSSAIAEQLAQPADTYVGAEDEYMGMVDMDATQEKITPMQSDEEDDYVPDERVALRASSMASSTESIYEDIEAVLREKAKVDEENEYMSQAELGITLPPPNPLDKPGSIILKSAPIDIRNTPLPPIPSDEGDDIGDTYDLAGKADQEEDLDADSETSSRRSFVADDEVSILGEEEIARLQASDVVQQ